MEIREIKAYKISNGKIFENRDSAEKAISDIELKKELNKFCDSNLYDNILKAQVATILFQEIEKLKLIINNYG